MKRREFLAGLSIAGVAPLNTIAAAAGKSDETKPEYYEMRQYHLLARQERKILDDFFRDAAIPAMNRIGIGPVGVFNAMYGVDSSTIYVLLPHKSLESLTGASSRLAADADYQKSGASFLNTPVSKPAYVRMESSLMAAFDRMPKLEVSVKKGTRIFELRTYESRSEKVAKKKIEMFNEGGEMAIFHKTGLRAVFFGETLIGRRLPNLTYMLAFDDMAERDRCWVRFRNDPDWEKLKANPIYEDTVSNITVVILRPTPYSQI